MSPTSTSFSVHTCGDRRRQRRSSRRQRRRHDQGLFVGVAAAVGRSVLTKSMSPLRLLFLLLLCASLAPSSYASAFGGEKRTFNTPPFQYNVTYRQDVCSRYDQFRNGEIDLRDSLRGLELRPLIGNYDYFNYDDENGIDKDDPGLLGDLMDELGQRAGFTWRNSFGVLDSPSSSSENNITWTWTDMLLWGIETYDVCVDWWDKSVERMDNGVAFLEPWFDGSLILIDKNEPPKDQRRIHWFNWLRPFEHSVWYVTILTVFVSGWVFQLIEHLSDDRNERPFFQWMMDNLYLSALNSTQNFEYAPESTAGRLFGFSMAMWALVMTATYTANLATFVC